MRSGKQAAVENGAIILQSSPVITTLETNHMSSKQIAPQENVMTSPQKTIIISPIANGIDNPPPAPLAKSKFRLTISRQTPGSTSFQPNGLEDGIVQTQVSAKQPSVTQNQSSAPIMVETSMAKESSQQIMAPVGPTNDMSQSETTNNDAESSPPKPKEVSIFQRLFKPEKKVESEELAPAEVPINEEMMITVSQNATLQSVPGSNNLQTQSPEPDSPAAANGQGSEPARPPAGQEEAQTNSTTDIHPVMSFFKTLVNKPLPKSEEELRSDAEDKSKKEDQTSGDKIVLKQPGVSLSVNPTLSPPEQTVSQDAKPSTVPQQVSAIEDEGKSAKEDTPRPRLFWRKASTEPNPQNSKPVSGAKPSAAADSKSQGGKKSDEGKSSKPKIMMFFKQLSVISDPGTAASEEGNEESKNSATLDITDGVELGKSEKTLVTAVVEPPPLPPQKVKDNTKEKKGSSEKLTKQESRESAEAASSSQIQAPESAPVLNRAEPSKESQLKRTDKRQSLGSFFKAIGPKRQCDAEVQTDPVSILPVEKAK